MGKKVTQSAKKPAKKPVVKPEVDKKVEAKVENVPFRSENEVKASEEKVLNFEEGVQKARMLLKCFGDKKLKLGKNTDGNVIHCKGETHAVLYFSDVWQLISICKL